MKPLKPLQSAAGLCFGIIFFWYFFLPPPPPPPLSSSLLVHLNCSTSSEKFPLAAERCDPPTTTTLHAIIYHHVNPPRASSVESYAREPHLNFLLPLSQSERQARRWELIVPSKRIRIRVHSWAWKPAKESKLRLYLLPRAPEVVQ